MGPKHRAARTDGYPRDTLSNGMYTGWEQGGKNANIRYIQVSLKVAALTDGERSSDSRHERRATVQTGPGWCSLQGKAEAIRDPRGGITQWSLHNQLHFFPLQDFKRFKRYSSIATQLLTLPSYCSHEARALLRKCTWITFTFIHSANSILQSNLQLRQDYNSGIELSIGEEMV